MRNALTTSDRALLELELNEADRLVQHHLIRARASALSGSAGTTVSVLAVVDDIARALRVLFVAQGLSIDIDHVDEAWVRCEREDLSEMLGNLMENACKWARSKVMVVIRRQAGEIVTVVSDDGPGLTSDQLLAVQTRGVRADEQMPGSGLGLAITIDLATLYNGRVILTCSRAGDGLIASLCLPAV
jgi:signal transduction histidine kinase